MSTPLRDRLREALTAAMKAKDDAAVTAFRIALGAIDNAGAVAAEGESPLGDETFAGSARGLGAGEVDRRLLGEGEIEAILATEVDDLRNDAARMDEVGRSEVAAQLRAQAAALDAFLETPPA